MHAFRYQSNPAPLPTPMYLIRHFPLEHFPSSVNPSLHLCPFLHPPPLPLLLPCSVASCSLSPSFLPPSFQLCQFLPPCVSPITPFLPLSSPPSPLLQFQPSLLPLIHLILVILSSHSHSPSDICLFIHLSALSVLYLTFASSTSTRGSSFLHPLRSSFQPYAFFYPSVLTLTLSLFLFSSVNILAQV